MRACWILLCLGLIGWSPLSTADEAVPVLRLEAGAVSPPARIGDIAWLEGHWIGQGLDGRAEDVIAPPVDGQMMGMFRHVKGDGSVNFYEFYLFVEEGQSLTQRLKHYSPALAGWEERDEYVDFPLVAIEANAAYFDGLSYVLREDGSLAVAVRLEEEKVAQFRYRRAD